MAKTKQIVVNGMIFDVIDFDHSAQEIDDAVDAALNAEPAIDVLPVEKGGTGVSVLTEIRENIGIAYGATVDANSSGAITFPTNGVFLVCVAGNANNGAILVFTGTASRGVDKVEELTALKAWSYSYTGGNLALTINNTANYSASFAVTSLRYSVYEGG